MPVSRTVPSGCQDIDCDDLKKTKERRIGQKLSVKCANLVIDRFVFPCLLLIHFGVNMYCLHQLRRVVLRMHSSVVLAGITAFCIEAVAYRLIFLMRPFQSLFLILIPDLFIYSVLAAAVYTSLETAFQLMLFLAGYDDLVLVKFECIQLLQL